MGNKENAYPRIKMLIPIINLCTRFANFFSMHSRRFAHHPRGAFWYWYGNVCAWLGLKFWAASKSMGKLAAQSSARLDSKHIALDPDELARLRRVADLARLFIVNSGNVIFTSENAHFDALRDEVIAQMEAEREAH